MFYEKEDIMVAEPRVNTAAMEIPAGCVSVEEAFRKVRKHVEYLYNGSLY